MPERDVGEAGGDDESGVMVNGRYRPESLGQLGNGNGHRQRQRSAARSRGEGDWRQAAPQERLHWRWQRAFGLRSGRFVPEGGSIRRVANGGCAPARRRGDEPGASASERGAWRLRKGGRENRGVGRSAKRARSRRGSRFRFPHALGVRLGTASRNRSAGARRPAERNPGEKGFGSD